jgi:hypothetical protein
MAVSSADRLRMRFDLLDADGSGTLTSADFALFSDLDDGGIGRVSTRGFAGFLRAFYTGADDLL